MLDYIEKQLIHKAHQCSITAVFHVFLIFLIIMEGKLAFLLSQSQLLINSLITYQSVYVCVCVSHDEYLVLGGVEMSPASKKILFQIK